MLSGFRDSGNYDASVPPFPFESPELKRFLELWPLFWFPPLVSFDWYLGPTFRHFSLHDSGSCVDHATLPLESRNLETRLGPNDYCLSTFQEFFPFTLRDFMTRENPQQRVPLPFKTFISKLPKSHLPRDLCWDLSRSDDSGSFGIFPPKNFLCSIQITGHSIPKTLIQEFSYEIQWLSLIWIQWSLLLLSFEYRNTLPLTFSLIYEI